MKISRDLKWYKEKLEDHLGFLRLSAAEFDRGSQSEALRMATSIRVLIHDTRNSTSLLAHLGMKDILFYDTATEFNPKNLFPTHEGLTIMKVTMNETGNQGLHVAALHLTPPSRGNKKSKFTDWWNKLVYIDKSGSRFTRADIVLSLANKDGGAHVDGEVDKSYYDFSLPNPLGFSTGSNEFENSPLLPSVRQITYEILKSIEEEIGKKNSANSNSK